MAYIQSSLANGWKEKDAIGWSAVTVSTTIYKQQVRNLNRNCGLALFIVFSPSYDGRHNCRDASYGKW